MKTSKLLLIFLMAFLTLTSFAQAKSISEEVYETVTKKAESETHKSIRTENTVETNYKNGVLISTSNLVKEYLPPDKFKELVSSNRGNVLKKTEMIFVGDFKYEKTNDGEWIKSSDKSGSGIYVGTVSVEKNEMKNDYWFEVVKEGKNKFQIYTVSIVHSLGTAMAYYENKTWIKDGLIYKKTMDTSFGTRKNVIYKSITDYNYNPNIKIDAPK